MRFTFSTMIVAALVAVVVLVIVDKAGGLRHPHPTVVSEAQQTARPAVAPKPAQSPPAAAKAPAAPSAPKAETPPTAAQAAAPPMNHAAAMPQMAGSPAPMSHGDAGAAMSMPAATPSSAVATPLSGAVEDGRRVFSKCQACHSLQPGKNGVGPSLAGIVGKQSASTPDFNYSTAMREAHLVWDAATIDAYLRDPQKLVPGNRMPFPGLKSEHDRTNLIAYLQTGGAPPAGQQAAAQAQAPAAGAAPGPAPAAVPATTSTPQPGPGAYEPEARYTLRTGIAEGRMVYIGVGGTIDGKVNPQLTAAVGQGVQLTLINGEGAEHDIAFPDQGAKSQRVTGPGASTTLAFRAASTGEFIYFCSVPGHRLSGMEGKFVVTDKPAPETLARADISHDPAGVPPPIGNRAPTTVRIDLETVELEGQLADGTTYGYWTFNRTVPGPMLRARVGDTVEVHLKNSADSSMVHSVDFHAVIGPGGGAVATQVEPGDEKGFTFKALVPGLYVYHCATPMVSQHIANGMYGMILIEPEGGLPKVDHEFYVMQGEIYTDAAFGKHGSQEFSVTKMLDEHPEYFVLNGAVGALTKAHPMHAKVGDTVRLFFGVGGPNFPSSFHVIGEIFDRVYLDGGVTSPPLTGMQTVTVPAGGAVITEFKVQVPGRYILVDHALARMERGLAGFINVEGSPAPDLFKPLQPLPEGAAFSH
jgi:nitrite reductase (NO-forming)